MTNWYLVYTRTGYEQRVLKSLEGKKFNSFLPLNRISSISAERNRLIKTPLFPNLVFVNTTPECFPKISGIRGVQHFLYWLSDPVDVSSADLETLQDFVTSHKDISVEKCIVSVARPFESLNFPIIKRDNEIVTVQNTVTKLYLPSLGYVLSVYHEHQSLEFHRRRTLETFSQS